jgi:hypothetical protein
MHASRPTAALLGVVLFSSIGCATPSGPSRYRLTDSGTNWNVSGSDRVLDELRPLYPNFFETILDTTRTDLPDVRPVRDDLERQPVTRSNYDALNAIAIAYFETNSRAETERGEGLSYLSLSQRSAKLVAIPWRAYAETPNPNLRNAILDFFEDAGIGGKLHTGATAPRLARVVASLERKEDDPARAQRIRDITAKLEALIPVTTN